MKNLDRVYITLAAGGALLIVGAVLVGMLHDARSPQTDPTPTPTMAVVSPTPSPEQTPAASPAPEVSPGSTPTPGAAELPSSAQTFLANFYAAFSGYDSARLNTYFTEDSSAELRSVRLRLFTGQDEQGIPGGPTLFATNTADQRAIGYAVTRSIPQGNGWLVTIQEQRVDGQQRPVADTMILMTLVPAPNNVGTWLVDAYHRTSETGKYSGFTTF